MDNYVKLAKQRQDEAKRREEYNNVTKYNHNPKLIAKQRTKVVNKVYLQLT